MNTLIITRSKESVMRKSKESSGALQPVATAYLAPRFMVLLLAGVIGMFTLAGNARSDESVIRFGMVTDVHYADATARGERHYKQSLPKMIEFIDAMNREEVAFVIQLGDLVDGVSGYDGIRNDLQKIVAEYNRFKGPRYHALGNHCLDRLTKADLHDVLGTPIHEDGGSYYSFVQNGILFLVLDACFRSDGTPYAKGNFKWTDAYIPKTQLAWIESTLAAHHGRALVFLHHELSSDDHYNVSNANQVRKILQKSGKVAAVFSGHRHTGGHQTIDGILYYTLRGLVQGNDSAYATVDIKADGTIRIAGTGRAESVKVDIKSARSP